MTEATFLADEAALPDTPIRRLVRWGLYPASWAVLAFGFWRIAGGQDAKAVWIASSAVLAVTYLVVELALPYRRRWAMTWRSLATDLGYILVNGAAGAAVATALGWFAITTAGRVDGLASDWPVAAQVVACLLIFEGLNYAIHRAMHEMGGPLGRFLWRAHAAHHLPQRLYLVVHAVFHPINGMIVQALVIVLPIWAMGYGAKAVAIFFMINGMHGLISHFNADVRLGWANYLFIGPETHRYHHSADVKEALNYGNTLSVYDLLFGTFLYRPGVPPAALGVGGASGLPPYERIGAVLTLPFGH